MHATLYLGYGNSRVRLELFAPRSSSRPSRSTWDPPPPHERSKGYTSSREEGGVATSMCQCGTTTESRAHIVGECEVCKEERDALEEEMRKLDVCDMEEFGRLESSGKTIVSYGIDGGRRRRNRTGIGSANSFYVVHGRSVMSAQMLEVSIRSRSGASSRKGCVVNGQTASNK